MLSQSYIIFKSYLRHVLGATRTWGNISENLNVSLKNVSISEFFLLYFELNLYISWVRN